MLIENGIDYEFFSKAQGKKFPNTFVFIGRLSKNKKIENLLHTFRYLKDKNFKLYVIGGEWDKKYALFLRELVKKLNLEKNIVFTGALEKSEMLEILKKAGFFLSASQYEGFGISVIEAMAAGCIPIVNDIEAFRHFVKHGHNGFILNFSNHKESAEKIREIMKRNDLERIRRNARKTAREYDWDNAIRKLVEVYEKVLKK